MEKFMIAILALILFFGVLIWLQIFLSNKQNKWLGLIIPLICLLFSLIPMLALPIYTTTTSTSVSTKSVTDGAIIYEENVIHEPQKPSISLIIATVAPIFIISNIPTIIFLAIYFACRERRKKNLELEKMNIQDLE